MIPRDQWQWFGNVGHFICGFDCRFHLCTLVGAHLVSTVGQLFPDAPVRELYAESRGVTLVGRGDARRADYMNKIGYEEVGYQRTFETMVFRAGEICSHPDCGCGMPKLETAEALDFRGYNSAGDATRGHMELCEKWAEVTS